MPKEIERKFKVKKLPLELLEDIDPLELTQTYLQAKDGEEVRVRAINNSTFIMTMKRATNSANVREEIECELTPEEYRAYLKLQIGTQIQKRRYKIPGDNGLTYELDVYQGDLEGLMVVEVEFPTEEMANSFVKPDWFGNEVTSDKRYKNASLAKNGMPEGHDR
jgi:CYTH domain-containing protein